MPNTLYDKIWNDHLVHQQDDGTALLFVDRLNVYQQIIMLFHHLVDVLNGHSKFYRKEY